MGRTADEAFGMGEIGCSQHLRAPFHGFLRKAMVDDGRGKQSEPGMAVFVVVPIHKPPGE